MVTSPPARRRLLQLLAFLFLTLAANLALARFYRASAHTPSLREKQDGYLREPGQWNLLFVGDSRTYTDFDPDRLDPLLGTRSLNLAHWAHWFPTQYPNFVELVPHIPPQTVVVWSIGEGNFRAVDPVVNPSYPIRPWQVPRYLAWGYALTNLQDNVADGLLDLLPLHALRDPARNFLAARLASRLKLMSDTGKGEGGAPTPGDASAANGSLQAEYDRRRAPYEADPAVLWVRPWMDGGRITSMEIVSKRGAYLREELDSLYFRGKQREMEEASRAADSARSEFTALPEYWNTFVGILDLFERHHVRLIVNRVAEAPFRNAPSPVLEERVRREIERHGFPCVTVDWNRFENSDYFDYNHLNRRGVERFTPLIATVLRPYVP